MSDGKLRDLAPRLQALIGQGVPLGSALDQLRDETDSPLEALKALRVVTGSDMESAVQTLKDRPRWRSLVARMESDTEAFFEQQ